MPYTPGELAAINARAAEREAIETTRIQALGAAASHYASLRRMNLKPTNQNLLWAYWEFAKALKEWERDGTFDDMFAEACHDLDVDEEGEELPADPNGDDYGDYLYEQRRDRLLDEQMRREGLA